MNNHKITIYQNPNCFQQGNIAQGFTKVFHIQPGKTDELSKAVSFDNCPAQYKDGHRKGENFLQANCILADIDNTHSDNSTEWITHDDVISALPGVMLYYYPSRNHMKIKNGKSARPKEHYIFPTDIISDANAYAMLMKKLIDTFPHLHFDTQVKSAAQLNYGVKNAQVSWVNGTLTISEYLSQLTLTDVITAPKTQVIPEGQRNSTLHTYAVKMLKRWGNADDVAYSKFLEKSQECVPLLEWDELDSIWKSASKFYTERICSAPEYIAPCDYNEFQLSLKPDDYSDIGQAQVFAREYANRICYSSASGYLYYNGQVWTESRISAQRLLQELTDNQLCEARKALHNATEQEISATMSKNNEAVKSARTQIKQARLYFNKVVMFRDSKRITAALTEARPMLEIAPSVLDAEWYLLNTPNGTVDLTTGDIHKHTPSDFCTKITTVSPSNTGVDLFQYFLHTITCGDISLEKYLQQIAGMCAIGRVFQENLIIAYGSGRNGKSTFFNLIARVLGDYTGNLSSETLTANCHKNKSPEYAELRGKRLVIAAELAEGMRLDTAIVKKLCSTDDIYAEKKYQAPFAFTPSHTVVLYTNHLPSVGTSDIGTWRRLVVIPFSATIEGNSDIKNYADYLYQNAGGAVLDWIIKGAKMFITSDYKIERPEVVNAAISNYFKENDWLQSFIAEECENGKNYLQKSGELYAHYRKWCTHNDEYIHSSAEFKSALRSNGFVTKHKNDGNYVVGLRLRQLPPYCDFHQVTDSEDAA